MNFAGQIRTKDISKGGFKFGLVNISIRHCPMWKRCVDWSQIDKNDYLNAMRESVNDGTKNQSIEKNALTDKIDDREINYSPAASFSTGAMFGVLPMVALTCSKISALTLGSLSNHALVASLPWATRSPW